MRGPFPTADGPTIDQWFGLDRIRVQDDKHSVDATIGTQLHWDANHLRKLRRTSNIAGLVPVVHAHQLSDGTPVAVSVTAPIQTLALMRFNANQGWALGVAIVEAAARILGNAHRLGLFHGAVSPEDVCVLGNRVAVQGVGLGWGGYPHQRRRHFAAPEVLSGEPITAAADVHSLGLLLFHVLRESTDVAPKSLTWLAEWATSILPIDRPRSADAFADSLAEALGPNRPQFGRAEFQIDGISTSVRSAVLAAARHMNTPAKHEFVEPVQPRFQLQPTPPSPPRSLRTAGVVVAVFITAISLMTWAIQNNRPSDDTSTDHPVSATSTGDPGHAGATDTDAEVYLDFNH